MNNLSVHIKKTMEYNNKSSVEKKVENIFKLN